MYSSAVQTKKQGSVNLNNNIDTEHKIESVVNNCKVTIYFSENRNNQIERNILENLLDTFEKRIKAQISC